MKKIKEYIYEGLGFPILLSNVSLVEIDGEHHPKIDIRKVADAAIRGLPLQKERLTGNQVKFIRTYFSMSLREFGKLMNESHMAVKKWEDFKNKSTNMDKNIEIVLRLTILDKIRSETKQVKKSHDDFHKNFSEIRNTFMMEPVKRKIEPAPLKIA